jgi:hypothetical protein
MPGVMVFTGGSEDAAAKIEDAAAVGRVGAGDEDGEIQTQRQGKSREQVDGAIGGQPLGVRCA